MSFMFVKPVRMDQASWFCKYNTISLKKMEDAFCVDLIFFILLL